MPQRSSLTKIVVIENNSENTLRFNLNRHEWQGDDVSFSPDSLSSPASVINVYPSEGGIEPGKRQILKVTVAGDCYPRSLDASLAVELLELPDDPKARPPSSKSDKQNERIAELKAASKIGSTAHVTVADTETLSNIGSKLGRLLEKAARLGRVRHRQEEVQDVLTKAYIMLTSVGSRDMTSENFIETVIRKLVKVGMKEDIDEMVSEGTHVQRDLNDIMDELEVTYRTRRKEPEIRLAFMLFGIDEVELPFSAGGTTKGGTLAATGGTLDNKVSFQSSSGMLPSTGMRGTMLMPRNTNKKKANDVLALKPDKTYVFLHITAEIVEEESYFELFGGDLKKDGITIPTTREFIYNPYELKPAALVESKDDFIHSGSVGSLGGSKESAAVRGLVTAMLSECVTSNDIRMQIDELPVAPRNPYLGEVQKKPPLMTSLQAAFDLFDVDASGSLTNAEVTNALKHLGLSTKNAEVKTFLKELDKDGDNEVDMREFLEGLSKEMAHKIANAMETNEDMIIALRAERQAKLAEGGGGEQAGGSEEEKEGTVEVLPSGGSEEEDTAATMLQNRARMRKAKQKVEQKRFLATAEGSEMDGAALMIQSRSRQRKAKQDLAKAAEIKRQAKLAEAALSEDLRSAAPIILGETVFNLLREALETPVCDREVASLEKELEEQENLQNLLENGGWGGDAGEEKEGMEEEEVEELRERLEELKRRPRFDLNLRPKTYVVKGE